MTTYRKANWLSLLVFALLFGFSACRSSETDLTFEILEQKERNFTGQVYETHDLALIIVAQPDEVKELDDWVTVTSKEQLQVMDYDTYFALAVFQGMKPTDGYSVQIERIVRVDDEVTIHIRLQEPLPEQKKNDTETSPYCLAKVQKIDTWNQKITFNVVADDSVIASASHDIP